MSKNRTSRFIPIIIAVSIVAGILIGTFYANHFSGNRLGIINTSSNKLNALLRIIDDQYVDTVKMNELVEDAMPHHCCSHRNCICINDERTQTQASPEMSFLFFPTLLNYSISLYFLREIYLLRRRHGLNQSPIPVADRWYRKDSLRDMQ